MVFKRQGLVLDLVYFSQKLFIQPIDPIFIFLYVVCYILTNSFNKYVDLLNYSNTSLQKCKYNDVNEQPTLRLVNEWNCWFYLLFSQQPHKISKFITDIPT